MHADIDSSIFERIQNLSRFWNFSRKKTAAELVSHLTGVKRHLEELETTRIQLSADLEEKTIAIADLEALGKRYSAELQAVKSRLQSMLIDLDEARKEITDQRSVISENENSIAQKDEYIEQLVSLADELKLAYGRIESQYQAMNQRHLSLSDKFTLVSKLLAQDSPVCAELDAFVQAVDSEFVKFANEEHVLADEASALLAMQNIVSEAKLIKYFPEVSGKTVLGVAGGFSSGKSEFISSFIEGGVLKLPVGINPVTAVPSYVVCSPEVRIRGYSYNGGSTEISKEIYKSLTHEYIQTFGFDLRRIMPFVGVQVPMRSEYFSRFCIIDTPGYNPGKGGGSVAKDRSTAADLVANCSALIWLIGIDQAGTIPQSDIDFLTSSGFSGDNLYIVLNKADTRSQDAIDDILQQVQDDLEFSDIECFGIAAYSSVRKAYYGSVRNTLDSFLEYHNKSVDVVSGVQNKIDAVFKKYSDAIGVELKRCESLSKDFNRIALAALEMGGSEFYERILELLPDGEEGESESRKLNQLLARCEELRVRLNLLAEAALA